MMMVWIGSTPLPLHAALQAAHSSRIWTKLCTQRLESGLAFPRHDGDAGRTQIQTHGVSADCVLGLVVGHAAERQWHDVTISLSVGALCAWTGGLTAHQSSVLDRVRKTMGDHRVVPIDERGQLVVVPDQHATMAFFVRLQHEAQARIVALVLEARKPAATTRCARTRRPLPTQTRLRAR